MARRVAGFWLGVGLAALTAAFVAANAQEGSKQPLGDVGGQAGSKPAGKGAPGRFERQDQLFEQMFGPLEIQRDLVYAQVDGKALTLDLFVPRGKAKAGEIRPLVIWVHGGGWRGGSKDPCAAIFLAKSGYAVASINYRLTGEASFPAQIWDCKAAVRFLRAKAHEFGYDPGAIGVMGGSAGGHLVALLGTTNNHPELEGKLGEYTDVSSNVQAVCDCFGPTDLTVQVFDGKEIPKALVVPMDPEKVLNTEVNKSTPKNELTDLLGGPPTRMMEKARLASPMLQISQQSSPFLIMHGDKDPIVPVYQSRVFAEKLKEAGVPVEYVEIAGAGHGGAQFMDGERTGQVVRFFDRNLRKIGGDPADGEKGAVAKPKGTLPNTYKTR
jgi:acetyl esterase/lipase